MRIERFFALHNIEGNPFVSAEEAQGDEILTSILEQNEFRFGHPAWAKFCGTPPGNQTSLVFGPKGSGKTAMRLALEKRIAKYNEEHPERRVLLVKYSDFNQYLDTWKTQAEKQNFEGLPWLKRLRGHSAPAASLKDQWTLTHHMDALLSEISKNIPAILKQSDQSPRTWPGMIKYDVLFLAATYLPMEEVQYTNTMREIYTLLYSPLQRYARTGRRMLVGICTLMLAPLWTYFNSLLFAKRAKRAIEVVERKTRHTAWALRHLSVSYLRTIRLLRTDDSQVGQVDRYDLLLNRVTRIAEEAGYEQTIVVMDKVDEPMTIHGSVDKMADFIRPLLTNKLLHDDKLHFKLLIPNQLHIIIRKADSETANKFRLDKANVIYPFEWSGADLYQMLTERLSVRAHSNASEVDLQNFFGQELGKEDVIAQLDKLKTPRYANKFMDRLVRASCSTARKDEDESLPVISAKTFYRVSAEMESDIRTDAQDLGEIL